MLFHAHSPSPTSEKGVQVEDLQLIMQGHVMLWKPGFEIRKWEPLKG